MKKRGLLLQRKEEVGGGVFEQKFLGGEDFRVVATSHWLRCGGFLLADQESAFLHLVIFVPQCQEGSSLVVMSHSGEKVHRWETV